jgi:hypothetical protein
VTSGTTNEAALRTLSDKQKLGIAIITAPDHAQSLATLVSGKADWFATDDVLLYGFIATAKEARDMKGRRRVSVLRSIRPCRLRRGGRAHLHSNGKRATARRALQQVVPAPATHGGNAQLPMSPQLEEVFRMLGQPE